LPRDIKTVFCYVTDRRSILPAAPAGVSASLIEIAERAAAAGMDWIQIREKDLAGGALFQLTSEILRRAASARVLVNDRLDVALAAGAAGVHLGGAGLPVSAVRGWVGERGRRAFLVGKSCHSLGESLVAQAEGADYVFFGPIFATPSKLAYGAPQGIDRLAEVCRRVSIPVIAIGGITTENAAECVAAGARGVAAIRLFQEPGDLAARMARMRAACKSCERP
jgi:thiamine-phosphate pyrophosphorylase